MNDSNRSASTVPHVSIHGKLGGVPFQIQIDHIDADLVESVVASIAGSRSLPEPKPGRARLLSAEQVAEQLGWKLCKVYQWARAGRLPAKKTGRDWSFSKDAIDDFCRSIGVSE